MTPRHLQPLEWFQQRNGWGESFNADKLVIGWKYSGLPEYKSIVGRDRAWCMMSINLMCHDLGLKGNGRADAISGVKSFPHCEFYPGCGMVVEHHDEHGHVTGHHITLASQPRVGFGGNQNNMICEKPLASTDTVLCYFTFIDLSTGHPIYPPGSVLETAPPTPVQAPAPKEISNDWPKLGDEGPEVLALQKMLTSRGFNPGPLDGKCGPRTMAAVNASKSASQTPESPAPTTSPSPEPVVPLGRLAWYGVNGWQAWDQAVTQAVKDSHLPDLNPASTIEDFCPKYTSLSRQARIVFWCHLIAKMTEFESGFNPHSIYHEPPPLGVDSVGLLQLSYEDAKHYPLPPLDRGAKTLENPLINIQCAVKIMEQLVRSSGIFCGQDSAGKWRGVSAYWSVMRNVKSGAPRPSFVKIREHCRALTF